MPENLAADSLLIRTTVLLGSWMLVGQPAGAEADTLSLLRRVGR